VKGVSRETCPLSLLKIFNNTNHLIFKIMRLTLKDLKENKGKKKEFKFLTPVVKLLEKEYKKLLPEFDRSLYAEAIKELHGEGSTFVYYVTPNELAFNPIMGKGGYGEYAITKIDDEKGWEVSNVQIRLNNLTQDPEKALNVNQNFWANSEKIPLEDLYMVTDEKAFEEFVFDVMLKREEKEIDHIKKVNKKEKETLLKNKELVGKYGEKVLTWTGRRAVEFLEAVKSDDEKEAFDSLLAFMENVEEKIEEEVDNRW